MVAWPAPSVPLSIYHLRLFSRSGQFVVGHFVRCADDEKAQAHAQQLVDRRGIWSVEIWHDGRRVCDETKRRAAVS